ncbi:hypothetical protein ACR5KS_03920 [Leucobacter sp. W1153]|uniref:hypothetical protein n=1 Tax=Leucobacter sp. W1153 TaxID=3439064 RepID=UPI003F2C97B8
MTYPGVGAARTHWYSLDTPVEQAKKVGTAVLDANPNAHMLYSGDIGADMVAGWRVPTRSAVHADHAINPETLGFTPTSNN